MDSITLYKLELQNISSSKTLLLNEILELEEQLKSVNEKIINLSFKQSKKRGDSHKEKEEINIEEIEPEEDVEEIESEEDVEEIEPEEEPEVLTSKIYSKDELEKIKKMTRKYNKLKEYNFDKLNLKQLKDIARDPDVNVQGYYKMKKETLLNELKSLVKSLRIKLEGKNK